MTSNLRAETIHFDSYDGHSVEAYLATTEGESVGGVVVIHHFPGYDEATKEIVRKFAANGYNAICVNLYYRETPDASSDDAAAAAHARGGVPDDQLVGDVGAAAAYLRALPNSNQKGRRHRVLLRGTTVGARGLQSRSRRRRRLLRRLCGHESAREHEMTAIVDRRAAESVVSAARPLRQRRISTRRPSRPRRFENC